MIYIKSNLKTLHIPATFEDSLRSEVMAYTNNTNFRSVSNTRVSERFKQVLVLVSTILIGMVVSVLANF